LSDDILAVTGAVANVVFTLLASRNHTGKVWNLTMCGMALREMINESAGFNALRKVVPRMRYVVR
jgi:hypothetical protein